MKLKYTASELFFLDGYIQLTTKAAVVTEFLQKMGNDIKYWMVLKMITDTVVE